MQTFDYKSQFEQMKKDTVSALTKILAADAPGTGLQIRVNKVWVDDDLDPADFESQRQAMRTDKTWGAPVYAALDLVDKKTGKVISKTTGLKVATLPKGTDLGSFIVKGQQYQVHNQFRRKPGVYLTEKENHEFKSEIHVAGTPMAIEFDKENEILVIKAGNSKQPLYPLLSKMGITDSAMASAWGQELLAKNKAYRPKAQASSVRRLARAIANKDVSDPTEAAREIVDTLYSAPLDKEVTQRILGQAFERVTPEVVLKSATELLKAQRGERTVDERHAIEFKKIYSVSDFLKDRFFREDGGLSPAIERFRGTIMNRLNNRKAPPTQIGRVVSTNVFTPLFENLFTKTGLSHNAEQTNPLQMLSGLSKVTIMGEGGVQDANRIKAHERSVHPSQLGFVDPIHSPDSENIGIVNTLPIGVVKSGNDLKTRVWDTRSKTYRYITSAEAMSMTMAFPDQFKDGQAIGKTVKALVGGETRIVKPNDVDAVLPNPRQVFSISSNSIPFLASAQGVRAQMSTKMLEQAIPLTEREAPLVQVKLGAQTIEKSIGDGFSIRAADDGVVEKVSGSRITIKTKDGSVEQPIYNNMPLSGKSFLHADVRVKAGDKVSKGQVLADSNFTSDGVLALGKNMLTAYIPYKGYTFEDGIVISEKAAGQLTSEHMYQYAQALDAQATLSVNKYRAYKPGDLNTGQLAKLDEDGVVKKGQIVHMGDPLWIGTKDAKADPDSIMIRKLGGKFRPTKAFKETWDNEVPGEVVDVVKSAGGVKVFVKSKEPAQVGDKLTSRHGAKGIIAKILPDGQMPHTVDGTPVDVLLNPHGIVTRMNPSQLLETAAGKIAKKTGKPYVVDNFSGVNYVKQVQDDLAKNGLKDTELLIDPATNKPLGEVFTGHQYILKLTKQATSQYSARADGKYDINKNPLKGGEDGAKAIDLLAMYSLLAHGARNNLREMATFKSTQNDQFWTWLRTGQSMGLSMPAPTPTLAYKKFESYLKAAGVDVERKGSRMVLQPMTDREVVGDAKHPGLSSGVVKEPLFLRAKDLKQEKGGFFDPLIFGSGTPAEQTKWGHIELAEPMPNPVFEKPIKKLTGLETAQFNGLIKGAIFVDPKTGALNNDGIGVTGGEAIRELLKRVDVDKQVTEWTAKAKTATDPKKLDYANKRLKYLHALKTLKLRPEDAYIQTKLPVLPPQFRPTAEMGDGNISVPGVNYLYRDIGLVNKELKWQKEAAIPESLRGELRENLYEGAKALYGLGDPIAYYPKERRPTGFIQQIAGNPAKEGFFQKQVIRRHQNLVGRGTIIPEPKLGVDEVGLPETMAWSLFQPFVIRKLVGLGYSVDDAAKLYAAKAPSARSALLAEMEDRPVLLNRAPSLHKFSIMAFKPKITDGQAIKIPPLIVKGFNADHDGDAMNVHVPVLQDAVKEAEGMFPSRNLYNPGTGDIIISPQNEAALGLWKLSKTPEGRGQILAKLPPELQAKYKTTLLDKAGLKSLMSDLADAHHEDFGKIVHGLKDLGENHTYTTGFTVSLKDLAPKMPEREKIFADLHRDIERETGHGFADPKHRDRATALIRKADTDLQGVMNKQLPAQGNRLFEMVDSGARGNMGQLKQVLSGPMLVSDHRGNDMPVPVTRSFAEGLSFSDYWSTLYGARAAAVDKQLQTQNPGAFTKDIIAASMTTVVSKADCKTHAGITLDVATQSRDIEDRYLAGDISVGGTVVAHAGAHVDDKLLNLLRERKVGSVTVRSPLTCRATNGVCAKCYGTHEDGKSPPIGENVGVIAGHSLSEPLTQMTLRTFHSGGLAGTRNIISGYEKIDKLLKMPKIKSGKATLSDVSGKVERIEPTTAGSNVFVAGQKHFVPRDLFDATRIKVGTVVERGSALSDGLIHPQELLERKGMLEAERYIVDEIQKAYGKEHINVKRRAIETVIRSVANTTRVIDPGSSDFIPGDIVPYTVAQDHNEASLGKKLVRDAGGFSLREDVGGIKAGTIIDDHVQKTLLKLGKSSVEVGNVQMIHQPMLEGIHRIPFMRNDWMSQLGYQKLREAIVEGASKGASTDIHGYSPIPAFAYGAEFGQAPGGKSKTEGVY